MDKEEIRIVNEIKDALGIDFEWMLFQQGMCLKAEALQTLLDAIQQITIPLDIILGKFITSSKSEGK